VGNNPGMIGCGNLPEDDWTLETIWGLLHMAGDDWTWEIKHLWNRTMTVELLNRRTRGHLSSYDKGGAVLKGLRGQIRIKAELRYAVGDPILDMLCNTWNLQVSEGSSR